MLVHAGFVVKLDSFLSMFKELRKKDYLKLRTNSYIYEGKYPFKVTIMFHKKC